jgi:hypothetical protein
VIQKELQHALHPYKLSFTLGYAELLTFLSARGRRKNFQKEATPPLHETLRTLITLFPYFLSGTWSAPTVSGTIPPPCWGFSLTMINNHQAVLFGGNQPGGDVYVLDLAQMVS